MVWYFDKKNIINFKNTKKSETGYLVVELVPIGSEIWFKNLEISSKISGPVQTETEISSTKLDWIPHPAQA